MMDKEIKAQWVKDLRDPARKQGTGTLRSEFGAQCCLDVLMEQAVKAGVISPPVMNEGIGHYEYVWKIGDDDEPYTEDEVLTDAVWQWAGLPDSNPFVTITHEDGEITEETLVSCNDDLQLDFLQIADAIESTDL